MAEFCLDCLRKIDNKDYLRIQVKLSKDLELCEGCGQMKRIVENVIEFNPFCWW